MVVRAVVSVEVRSGRRVRKVFEAGWRRSLIWRRRVGWGIVGWSWGGGGLELELGGEDEGGGCCGCCCGGSGEGVAWGVEVDIVQWVLYN